MIKQKEFAKRRQQLMEIAGDEEKVGFQSGPDDGRRLVEPSAAEKQLTIQGVGGHVAPEPVRCGKGLAVPADELVAVPDRPNAIELLGHPPTIGGLVDVG